jgi:O-antigen/teichoic acid export membrane protein
MMPDTERAAAAGGRTDGGAAAAMAEGSSLLFLARVLGGAGYFAAVLVLARALGPPDRGAVAFVITAGWITAYLLGLGVRESATVFAAQRPEERSRLFSTVLVFAGLVVAVGSALVCGILLALGGARPEWLSRSEIVAFPMVIAAATLATFGYASILGTSRFRQISVIASAGPWLYTAILAALWAAGNLTVVWAAAAWAIAHGLWGGTQFLIVLEGKLGRPSLGLLVESIRFGIRAWVGSLSDFLNFRADQILLGVIATDAVLGLYAVAVNGGEIVLYVPSAAAAALMPIIAGSLPELRAARTLRSFRVVGLVTLVTVVLAAATGPFLMPIVFGDAYDSSVTPFLLLLPGALGFVALSVFSAALVASSAPGLSSLGAVAALVVSISLDFALIPPYGASGAAAASSIGFAVGGMAALLAYRRIVVFSAGECIPHRDDVRQVVDVVRSLSRRLRVRAAAS